MKLGLKVENGATKLTAKAVWLKQLIGKALVNPVRPDTVALSEHLPEVMDIKLQDLHHAHPELTRYGWHLFLLDVDPYSNTLSVCVPIWNAKEKGVEMNAEEYDLYIKRRGWPVLVVDLDAYDKLLFLDANTLARIDEAEKHAEETADEGAE